MHNFIILLHDSKAYTKVSKMGIVYISKLDISIAEYPLSLVGIVHLIFASAIVCFHYPKEVMPLSLRELPAFCVCT